MGHWSFQVLTGEGVFIITAVPRLGLHIAHYESDVGVCFAGGQVE